MDSVTCANVIEIIGKTGSRGGITQVKVQFATPSGNRTLVRNVKGPVRIGDRLALLECEREARRLRQENITNKSFCTLLI